MKIFTLSAVLSCCLLVAACGGGGSGSAAGSSSSSGSALSGTVAVGAPMQNATLTVLGANGQSVSTGINSDGSYSNLNIGSLTAPYRLQACGTVNAIQVCHYAVAQAAGTANVTPLTTATLTLALGNDPASMMSGSAPASSSIASSQQSLQSALSSVLSALGLSATQDFTTASFAANRTGMDKLLDTIRVSTGQNGSASFVQLEGLVGAGNFYIDTGGSQAGGLADSTLLNGLAVDLTGISQIFRALNAAVSSSTVSACTSAFSSANILDAAFSLSINNQAMTAANAASTICNAMSQSSLLGGTVADPVLRDCDFSGSDKFCTVGFDILNGGNVQEGAELTIVLRNGSGNWLLLGNRTPYEIHVNASVQRNLRVNASSPQPAYTRAISFDISSSANGVSNAVQAARVYQRNAANTGWDTQPIVALSNVGCTSQPRLTINGSSCGATWLSLDSFNNASLANGDAMIDAFYRRGRQVRIDLYSDQAATSLLASVVQRIDGVPPKSAQLAGLPWLTLDASSQSALANYASTLGANLAFAWTGSNAIVPHDASFCADASCSNPVQLDLSGKLGSAGSSSFNLGSLSLAVSDYKQIALYGRDRQNVGYESNYISCTTGVGNCQ
ncbi:hypothetical protein [Chromobacterium sp. IIBBL 290-4]|uniref:hypothetical protein n=1 Tax=Chromobacterium sp. IIBBL 290-4 TaxID=2953890 RepID=UPI0020B6B3CC|nr:hypothetical protein [Chromobacterium sp. IIBBL 290-4]UTH73536.1 hypothetical protein NKT35_18645 [Chromobacterium sp. IIBBL 290-4]